MTSARPPKTWTPPDGPSNEMVLFLLEGGASFWHSWLVNPMFGYTDDKPSNAAAVIRKLRDSSFHVTEVELHPHDHPEWLGWSLDPGMSVVEVTFCKTLDTRKRPVSFFKWWVSVETPAPGERLSLARSEPE